MVDSITVRIAGREHVGELVAVFRKREGAVRCVVEDVRQRLVVCNPAQLGLTDDSLIRLAYERGVAAGRLNQRANEACLSAAEQKAQAARCGCRGADDMCPCQNVPDATTRAERTAAKFAAQTETKGSTDG